MQGGATVTLAGAVNEVVDTLALHGTLAGVGAMVVVGLVPLTVRLDTTQPEAIQAFASELVHLAQAYGKWLGVAVEGGALFDLYRQELRAAGLPVFLTMEEALEGLRLIASEV